MEIHSFSEPELSALWNRKNKRYAIKSFIRNGKWITKIIFHDKCVGGKVVGKLVHKSSGEFHHRPWLHHRNLASLIDMVSIHDNLSIFISAYQNKSLREIVHDENFVNSSNCFILKKTYVEDVLWGLDYLHGNGLCLMNLSDANVSVCEQPSKTIITDFGCLTQVDISGSCEFEIPVFHQPPELRTQVTTAKCNPIAAEMWVAGMMILEVFTQHKIPWALVDYEPNKVLEVICKIDFEMLKVANRGSVLSIQDFCEFKTFVSLFLCMNPQDRIHAREAASTPFLQSPKYSVDLKKASLRSNRGITCSEEIPIANYSPDHYRMLSRKLFSRSSNVLHTLNALGNCCHENKTEKSKSSVNFKQSDNPGNQKNTYIPHQIPPKFYKSYENMCEDEQIISTSIKKGSEVNLGKNILKIVNSQLQNKEINSLDNIQPVTRQSINNDSKMSFSSLQSNTLSSCNEVSGGNELDSVAPSIISSDNSSNENINVTGNAEPYSINDRLQNIKSEKSYSKLFSQMENYQKNLFNLSSNLSTECTKPQYLSPSYVNLNKNFQDKDYLPYNMENCTSVDNFGNDSLHQTTSDQVFTTKILNYQKGWNDLSRSQIEDSKRKSRSLISLKNSVRKPRTPLPDLLKKNFVQDSKIEPKIVSKTPYTLSKHILKSSNGIPSYAFKEDQIKYLNAVNELKKLNDGNMQNKLRCSKETEQKTPLANKFETCNTSNSVYLPSNKPSTGSVNFRVRSTPDVLFNVKKIPNCRFNHGNRCPKHQKAELIAQSRHGLNIQDNNQEIITNAKVADNYKHNFKLCGNANIESKVPDCNHENITTGHNNCSLPDYYFWFPPSTSSNVTDSQLLSPNTLNQNSDKDDTKPKKTIRTQRLSYTKAIWAGQNLHDRKNADPGLEELTKHVDKCHKLIRQGGPLHRKKCNYKIEVETHTRRVIRKKTPAKNVPKKIPDYSIIEESSDEKKPKKRKALKKCFCMF